MREGEGAAPGGLRRMRHASPPGSPFAPRAIQGRVELEIEPGRLADAERIVDFARKDSRIEGSGLGLFLGPSTDLQGRVDEAGRFVEARWDHLDQAGEGGSEEAISLVRLYVEPPPGPPRRSDPFLPRSGRGVAAEDDRVWLGKAEPADPCRLVR